MAGTPAANAGQWANAALNTTLKQALKAPRIRKTREVIELAENFEKDPAKSDTFALSAHGTSLFRAGHAQEKN
jgi:hypothetical protein